MILRRSNWTRCRSAAVAAVGVAAAVDGAGGTGVADDAAGWSNAVELKRTMRARVRRTLHRCWLAWSAYCCC
uniref:Putative secreted protein n=1 Tax=Anopheles darlingi TaxID=43151 RepID=A0A2M4DES2_ANODA